MDGIGGKHSAHRNGTVGQALCRGNKVRLNTKVINGKRRTKAAKTGNNLVKDQKNTVFGADIAQTFQIPLWRDQNTGRTGNRFDNHSRNGRGIMQRAKTFKIIGQIGTMFGYAARHAILFGQMGMANMVNPPQHRAKGLAVGWNTPDGNTAKVHPMIAAFATNQAGPLAFAACAMIGKCNFKRGFNRFRT